MADAASIVLWRNLLYVSCDRTPVSAKLNA
jgi:hypothetical protein